jgi:hypothetical protein
MANGAHPARGDSDVPEDLRGPERALASTAVDSKAAGPHMVGTRRRINWPAQGNATEPRPPSQKPTGTRDVEGEPPWDGINKQRRGTESAKPTACATLPHTAKRTCQDQKTSAREGESTTTTPTHPKPSLDGWTTSGHHRNGKPIEHRSQSRRRRIDYTSFGKQCVTDEGG